MRKTILIVEDDRYINDLIAEAMTKAGYDCVQALNGGEALEALEDGGPDLVILDIMLPGMSGRELLPRIKELGAIPVIVVSARDGTDSKVDLLTLGAEDYVTKPFDVKELVARAGVQLRRFSGENGLLRYRDMTLDPSSFTVTVAGQPVALTKREFMILELMVSAPPGRVFSKQDFFTYAWADAYLGEDKTINVHISNIRKKLREVTQDEYIETVWGIGFRLA